MLLLSKCIHSQVHIAMVYFSYNLPLLYIVVDQLLPPYHRTNIVDCYIYISPHFIDTDHTTDVSQSATTSHISYILYALSLGVVQYE